MRIAVETDRNAKPVRSSIALRGMEYTTNKHDLFEFSTVHHCVLPMQNNRCRIKRRFGI